MHPRCPAPAPIRCHCSTIATAIRKFGLSSDGIGFPGNPRLGLSKPKASAAFFIAGSGITNVPIRLNYRQGLFSFRPLKQP